MSVNCIPIRAQDARLIWPHVSHFIQDAIDKSSDRFLIDDVLSLIESNKCQLFIFRDDEILSAWVTSVESSPSHTWLRVMWVGGKDLDKWFHFLQPLEQWAKSIGCEKVVVIGRCGWEKKLKDYKKTAVILEKVI